MIAEMSNTENYKFLEERKKKFSLYAQKIKSRHDLEIKAFNNKIEATYAEFKKNRAIEFDK
jgi:hypothetical protein